MYLQHICTAQPKIKELKLAKAAESKDQQLLLCENGKLQLMSSHTCNFKIPIKLKNIYRTSKPNWLVVKTNKSQVTLITHINSNYSKDTSHKISYASISRNWCIIVNTLSNWTKNEVYLTFFFLFGGKKGSVYSFYKVSTESTEMPPKILGKWSQQSVALSFLAHLTQKFSVAKTIHFRRFCMTILAIGGGISCICHIKSI